MNKDTLKTGGLALLMALAPGAAKAVNLVSTPNFTLNGGALLEELGELENTSNNSDSPYYYATKTGAETTPMTARNNTRIYLFQTQDLLNLDGSFDGTKFWFQEALGGASISTSNNQANLYEMYAEVPVNDNLSVIVGQFKVPSSLSSAQDVGSLLFTESSPLFGNFFNLGYDNGVGLKGQGQGWDATLGTISGSPDLPQRYLPEIFQLPPLLYTRFGVGDITDDPYQQKQVVSGLKDSQWGLHFNGEYINDSNAGHSDDLALQNTDATTVSSDNVFGNALLWSNWNPFMGKTATLDTTSPVNSDYWNASVDTQYRRPVGKDKTLILSAQWSFAEFNNNSMYQQASEDYLRRATINLTGGELVAGLNADRWALATRFDIVLPSNYLIYNSTVYSESANAAAAATHVLPAYQQNTITGDKPICELTFPSLTLRINKYVRVTGEGLFWLNSPEASGDDGVYELMEMPSQVTDLFPGNPMAHNPLVCVGRMAFTLDF
ncbi:MAG TPA: porin [bacterium]|nr:porin [bacterium]